MTISHVCYRAGLGSDARAMVEVHYASVQATGHAHYSREIVSAWSPPPDAQREDWLSTLITRDTTVCEVAVSGKGSVVGFGIAIPLQALLKALYVHPDCSGVGVGKALLQRIEDKCRSAGLQALELKASYNAEAFYRGAGYEVIGPTTQPLTDTVSMAAVHMAKRLPRLA